MVRDKVRIRFRKAGDLRLIGHHDLLRSFERMLRRAGLPIHFTEGFNPKPRLVFPLTLPLGVVGCQEVVDLELDAELPLEDLRQRLVEQAPAGLEILTLQRRERRRTGQVCQVTYRLPLPPQRGRELPERIAALLALPACWVERSRPQARRIDVRPYILALRLADGAIEMDLRVTPTGTARSQEILGLLGLEDLLASGSILERSRLLLDDEDPAPQPWALAGGEDS